MPRTHTTNASSGAGKSPAVRKNTRTAGKNPKAGRKQIRKFILFSIGALLLFGVFYSFTVVQSCERIDTSKIYSYISESSIIYDDKGRAFDTVYVDGGNRQNVKYKEMPADLVDAAVAIEDKTFWTHHGFNFIRMGGAVIDSIRNGSGIGGTSTITQQLARNVYLASTKSERTLSRKISEAYYTVLLEKNMSKKEIMEAYLNTIYYGYGCYGVQTAAKAYFDKDVDELDLAECAALASIPNSPDNYALVKTISNSDIEKGNIKVSSADILSQGSDYTLIYNGDASEARRNITLENMYKYGFISKAELNSARQENLRKQVNLSAGRTDSYSSYFTDFVIDQVKKDLIADGYSKDSATTLIYTGGLKIYTSLNRKAQKAIESAFRDSSNFPSTANINYDNSGNILSDSGSILLYRYSNYFDGRGRFHLRNSEFSLDSAGDMTIKKDRRLIITKTSDSDGNTDYAVSFKNMYTTVNGALYTIDGGKLNIPAKYKSLDDKGNVVISRSFFYDYPNYFKKTGTGYIIRRSGYTIGQKVRQPQAAMVIIDNDTGAVKAMAGGRGSSGSLLYNRALSTRQPGSSIKPLAIYSSALQQGADAGKKGQPMDFTEYSSNQNTSLYGDYWTASSVINDAPLTINGKIWPKNWYNGYRGEVRLRTAVEQSINVCSVRIWQQVGSDYIVGQLKKFGVSSLVTDDSSSNDMNASALALGGMAKGISPLEMASAYQTFQNRGTHIEYSAYKKIKDVNGKVILRSSPAETKVIDASVAFIMSDILRTTVTNGIARAAQVTGQTTAGKTGTTTDNYDAWFCGFTPQYSAALWIGNDVNIELSEGSSAAARLWSLIMTKATAGLSGSFESQPQTVTYAGGEYYADGTYTGSYGSTDSSQNSSKKENTDKKNDNAATDNNTDTNNNTNTDNDNTTDNNNAPQ